MTWIPAIGFRIGTMKHLLAIAFLTLFSQLCFGSGLKGKVTDSEGGVIANAVIFVHWDSSGSATGLKANKGIQGDQSFRTDKEGRYSAELPPGFYDLLITSPAFSPVCKKVWIANGPPIEYSAKLNADPLVIEALGDTFH